MTDKRSSTNADGATKRRSTRAEAVGITLAFLNICPFVSR
jgi:hypothetical protein